ncbi:MAG: NACHT domain-containing protein, partial [Deltaproteobacteria bacterium]|nr:NACHT domain-containing protein [Deltaproteobacteria bacterium]
IRKDRGIIHFSEASLDEELEDIRAAVTRLEAMKGNMPGGAFKAAVGALMEQREDLKNLMVALKGPGAAAQGSGAVATGERGVAIGGDGKGNVIITGDQANVRVETGNAPFYDSTEALRIYCETLLHTWRRLPMRGLDLEAGDPHSRQRRMDLTSVYVDMDTKTLAREKGEEKGRGPRVENEKTRPLSALAAVGNKRLAVLLGDPGSGKTTFINHLALCLAGNHLDAYSGWLERLKGWPGEEAETIPILVVLRDFAGRLTEETKKAGPGDLWNFISEQLNDRMLDFAVGPLKDALEEGRAIVLFDGMDEIPGRKRPGLVKEAVAAFAGRYRKSRFVVTCRVQSYRDKAIRLEDFSPFELAPFEQGMIDHFINAWYAELARLGEIKTEEDAHGLADGLKEAVRKADIQGLAPNPLLLTVMAIVHTHRGKLPEARSLLYDEIVDILLWRWDQIKAVAERGESRLRELLRDAGRTEVDLKRVLWQLAFEAHEGLGEGRDSLADIPAWRLAKALSGLHDKGSLDWADQVINTIRLRAGLLLERQPGVYTFPHRTFQEYLAGAYLASRGDFAGRTARLAAQGPFWREVALLAVGHLVYKTIDFDKPLALVAELCPLKIADNDTARCQAWLAGDCLVEMGLNRVKDSALGRELIERVSLSLLK